MYDVNMMKILMYDEMRPDYGKPIKLSHLIFREILILNIQATVVPLC